MWSSTLLDEAHFFSKDNFEGLGRIELRILAGKDFPKRVAMVRSTGMKIYEKGHFQTPLRFAGVFLAKGEKLNEVLRSMEPPSHNDWQYERHEDPANGKALLRTLHGWMNDCVRQITGLTEAEELDAEGISQYLPDEFDQSSVPQEDSSEGEKG